jgi:cell wall-associated NlpC family hydrolase
MKKKVLFLALSFGLLMSVTHQGQAAIQRKHRPWFSFSSPRQDVSRPQQGTVPTNTSLGTGRGPETLTKDTGSRPTIRRDDGDKGRKITKQALHYQGTRYKFGGTTKRGLDCSGLVNRVWDDLKMEKIPRVSSALYHSGKPVHLADLRPGDLVFFKNTYRRGISHVGVYTGNNKFVHAANRSKGVTITKLSDPYYQLHYAGARRLY